AIMGRAGLRGSGGGGQGRGLRAAGGGRGQPVRGRTLVLDTGRSPAHPACRLQGAGQLFCRARSPGGCHWAVAGAVEEPDVVGARAPGREPAHPPSRLASRQRGTVNLNSGGTSVNRIEKEAAERLKKETERFRVKCFFRGRLGDTATGLHLESADWPEPDVW